MTGGKGDDAYVVNSAGDVVNELVLNNQNGGIDTVQSSVTFTLATRANVENLDPDRRRHHQRHRQSRSTTRSPATDGRTRSTAAAATTR